MIPRVLKLIPSLDAGLKPITNATTIGGSGWTADMTSAATTRTNLGVYSTAQVDAAIAGSAAPLSAVLAVGADAANIAIGGLSSLTGTAGAEGDEETPGGAGSPLALAASAGGADGGAGGGADGLIAITNSNSTITYFGVDGAGAVTMDRAFANSGTGTTSFAGPMSFNSTGTSTFAGRLSATNTNNSTFAGPLNVTSTSATTFAGTLALTGTNTSTFAGALSLTNTNSSTLAGTLSLTSTNTSTFAGRLSSTNTNSSTFAATLSLTNTNTQTFGGAIATSGTNASTFPGALNVTATAASTFAGAISVTSTNTGTFAGPFTVTSTNPSSFKTLTIATTAGIVGTGEINLFADANKVFRGVSSGGWIDGVTTMYFQIGASSGNSILCGGSGSILGRLGINAVMQVVAGESFANVPAPAAVGLEVMVANGATSTVVEGVRHRLRSTGTAATGLGFRQRTVLESSTTNDQNAAAVDVLWADATHASRCARAIHYVSDAAADRECLRLETNGTSAMAGFLGAAAVIRQNVTGSRASTALAALLTALATQGLITDSTTA